MLQGKKYNGGDKKWVKWEILCLKEEVPTKIRFISIWLYS